MSMEIYAVVRPKNEYEPTPPLPVLALDAEHAEAIATVKRKEYPDLGPYRVVRLVEAS